MAAVPEIHKNLAGQQASVTKKSNNSKLFDGELVLEQADALLKNTGQYARWQQVRQNNDRAALWLGKRLLERHELVEKWQQGESVDRKLFDQLTSQLKTAGIHLYTLRQMQESASGLTVEQSSGIPSRQPLVATPVSTANTSPAPSQALTDPRVAATFPVASAASPLAPPAPSPLPSSEPVTVVPPSVPAPTVVEPEPLPEKAAPLPAHSAPPPAVEKITPQPEITTTPPPASPVLSPQEVAAAHPAVSPTILAEENLLILDLECPQIGLQDTILGYADEQTVMLPLSSILQGLDFQIIVEPEQGTASGWFINEDRSFILDLAKQQVSVNGVTQPLPPGSVLSDQGEIYVSAKNLASWFPLDFDISRGELAVVLTPLEQLPKQAQLEREKRRQGIGSNDIPLQYPIRPLEYEPFSLPVLDVTMSGGTGTKGLENSALTGHYSILAQGDLAYMNSYFYASGYEDSPTDTARIRLERVDPENSLFGPLHASRVAVGDILPATFPVLNNVPPERGVYLSNEDLVHSTDYDTTRFEGNLQPGWEVELYRNGSLLYGKVVGLDGRYLFDEVQLYFGDNDFVVKAYGPQGQQKILQDKSIRVGSEMLPRGNFLYRMSASQEDTTILGLEDSSSQSEYGSGRVNALYRYGLTQNLSLSTGVSSVEFSNERHNYLLAGVSGNLSYLYGAADYLYDTATGGSGLSVFGQTAVSGLNIKATYDFFSDFVMESRPDATLKSRARVDLNGNLAETAFMPPVTYTFSTENTQYTDYDTASLSNRLSTRLGDIYLSNLITWQYGSNTDDNPFDGQLQASGNIGPVRLTGSMKYRFGDDNNVTRYGLSSQWQVREKLRAGLDLIQDADYYNRTTASAKVDWDSGVAMVTPRVSYDSDGKFGAFLSLSFSLGKDPASGEWSPSSYPNASRGNISTFVYHDQNNNKLFDEEDTPLSDVDVKIVQGQRSTTTSESGYALARGLQPYVPTDVEVDQDTLEDPFWLPSVEGVAVRPRPGHYDQVKIPIVAGGEIDGTVLLVDKYGVRQPLANVLLDIVDPEGEVVRSIRSEYDGFYLFDKVLPGAYTLRVSPEDTQYTSLSAGVEIPVTIGNDGTIISGTDIILQDPAEVILQDPDQGEEHVIAQVSAPVRLEDATSLAAENGPVRLWPDPLAIPSNSDDFDAGTVSAHNGDGERKGLKGEEPETAEPPLLARVESSGQQANSSTDPQPGIQSGASVSEAVSESLPVAAAEAVEVPAVRPSVLPVVEYSLAAQEEPAGGSSASGRLVSPVRVFSVMPQPIESFRPIELAAMEPTRRINPYTGSLLNNVESKSMSNNFRQRDVNQLKGIKVIG